MLGVRGELIGVALKLGQVVEGIGPAELAGVNQAHEDIAELGSTSRSSNCRVSQAWSSAIVGPLSA